MKDAWQFFLFAQAIMATGFFWYWLPYLLGWMK